MDAFTSLAVALAAYLLGSTSFARLVTRWLTHGQDITQLEIPVADSDDKYKVVSVGGNSAGMALGARGGLTVGLLDILKVLAPTLACRLFFPAQPGYTLLAALAGLVGHIWPIYYRFHGGSGFSAIIAGLLVIDWPAAMALPLAGLLLGMVAFRNLIVATLSWIWLLIPWFWFRTHDPVYVAYAVAVNVLFTLAMLPEARLARKYQREGKFRAYNLGSLQSNPMGRSMLKIAAFFKVPVQ